MKYRMKTCGWNKVGSWQSWVHREGRAHLRAQGWHEEEEEEDGGMIVRERLCAVLSFLLGGREGARPRLPTVGEGVLFSLSVEGLADL